MPQQSLLETVPPMTSLRLALRLPEPGLNDHLQCFVQVGTAYGDPRTVFACHLQGLETDLLSTMVSEVTTCWLYGETPKDVKRIAATVKKQAQRHRIGYGAF